MRLRSMIKATLVVAALGIGSQALAASDLVTNGSFETGDFTGWTRFGSTSFTGVVGFYDTAPTDGAYQAVFGPPVRLGGISQTLTTVAGGGYNIAFDLYNPGGTPSEYIVKFGNTVLADVTDSPSFPYTHYYSLNVMASSNSTNLALSFRQDANYFQLDNVSVTSLTPVPIPAAAWLVGSTLMGLFGFVRKKNA